MPPTNFEILAYEPTELGILCLRRRELLAQPGTWVTEVTLNHEFLMSSSHTDSEQALAREALAMHGGSGLNVLVGGLGLGYTAQAALSSADATERVPERFRIGHAHPVSQCRDQAWLVGRHCLRAGRKLAVRFGFVVRYDAGDAFVVPADDNLIAAPFKFDGGDSSPLAVGKRLERHVELLNREFARLVILSRRRGGRARNTTAPRPIAGHRCKRRCQSPQWRRQQVQLTALECVVRNPGFG